MRPGALVPGRTFWSREEFAISLADSYRANAAAAARDAASTVLPHVKERCLRSEAAWLAMAERFEQAEVKQAERVAEQAARKSAQDALT